jgi:hypothetical protein
MVGPSSRGISGYSSFGIAVDRKHALKWLFHQEKATIHYTQKVYVYSETALDFRRGKREPESCVEKPVEVTSGVELNRQQREVDS